MEFIRKIFDLIKDNFKIKLGICLFLIVALIAVVVGGIIYSNNLNSENLAFQVIKKITSTEKENKVDKEEEEEAKKEKELEDIKNKIKELDESIDLSVTEGDVDKDILYYENLYNELLASKEDNDDDVEEETPADDTYNEEIYYEPSGNTNTVISKPQVSNPESNQSSNITPPAETEPETPVVEDDKPEEVDPVKPTEPSDEDDEDVGQGAETPENPSPSDPDKENQGNSDSQTSDNNSSQLNGGNNIVE